MLTLYISKETLKINAFASSSSTATITMTLLRDLQRLRKNELAEKARVGWLTILMR